MYNGEVGVLKVNFNLQNIIKFSLYFPNRLNYTLIFILSSICFPLEFTTRYRFRLPINLFYRNSQLSLLVEFFKIFSLYRNLIHPSCSLIIIIVLNLAVVSRWILFIQI